MENTKLKMRARNLKDHNRCLTRRGRKLDLDLAKSDIFEKSSFQKKAVKGFFLAKHMVKEPHFEEKYRAIFIRYIITNTPDEELPEEIKQDVRNLKLVLSLTEANYSRLAHFDVPRIIKETFKTQDQFDDNGHYVCTDIPIIKRYLEHSFQSLGDITVVTCKRLTKKAYDRVRRYLLSETRLPYVTGFADYKTMDMFDLMEVEDKPDFLFYSGNGEVIEAVKLLTRRPDVTQTGSARDHSANNSLELYSKLRYARDLVPEGKSATAIGSFCFLSRNDDKKSNGVEYFTDDFFARSGGNVISIEEYITPTTASVDSPLDERFKPQFEKFIEGEECSGKACANCDFVDICSYAEAPLCSTEIKAGKSIADIVLSKQQSDAVSFRKGIGRINAGAGCGKTLVVALRTAYMLSEGIAPEDILLVTFTNAGAGEMKERIAMYDEDLMTDSDLDNLKCTTFNSFGNDIIEEEYLRFGFSEPPKLIDDIQRKAIITELLNRTEIKALNYESFLLNRKGVYGALAVVENAFSIIKKNRYSIYDLEEFASDMASYLPSLKGDVAKDTCKSLLVMYAAYDETLKMRNLIEFQDQEALIFDLLDEDPYYFDNSVNYKHIIVDEFQDSSANQIELVRKLTETKDFESLIVVGDDSQTIFEFRDAVTENIVNFAEKIGKPVTDFFITENHRSTPEILGFANKLIKKNVNRVEKDLLATKESGKPVVTEGFYSKDEEYDFIRETVAEKLKEGYKPEDIAVLAYTRQELLAIAGTLAEAGIETSLQCPEPMLDNSRVKGIIAFSNALNDYNSTKDILVYLNVLNNGNFLKSNTDEEILKKITETRTYLADYRDMPFNSRSIAFDSMITDLSHGDAVALELVERLKRLPTLMAKQDYLNNFIAFGGDAIKRDGKFSGVVLATAHSSKGLEWPVCINSITGYHKTSMASTKETEANRRLLFVSSTRAKDELYITGQYRIGKGAGDNYLTNLYLEESFVVNGKSFSPRTYEEERVFKEKEKAEKLRLKKEAEAQAKAVKPVKKGKKAKKAKTEKTA